MRQILDTEEHVQTPPAVYSDPIYRITYLIKEQIRKYKWIQGENGHKLSWEQARQEWTDTHRVNYEKFLIETFFLMQVLRRNRSRRRSLFFRLSICWRNCRIERAGRLHWGTFAARGRRCPVRRP
jgi:hypothetical protein